METKVDEDYSRRVLDANRRKNKLDKLREKELERQKNVKDINDVLLSHHFMTEEIQFRVRKKSQTRTLKSARKKISWVTFGNAAIVLF